MIATLILLSLLMPQSATDVVRATGQTDSVPPVSRRASLETRATSKSNLDPEALDRAIEKVISQREYQWRMPREIKDDEKQGLFFEFLNGVYKTTQKWWNAIKDWYYKIRKWFRKSFPSLSPKSPADELTPRDPLVLMLLLIIAIVVITVFFIWRRRKRKRAEEPVEAQAIILPVPDLSDENTIADQLPEEGWQNLAADLMARGELRLALRALFMATLAYLARSEWITIARFKSNRDYMHEIKRRMYERTVLQNAFSENISTLERVWYGLHPVTQEMLFKFRENHDLVKRHAA